MEKKILDELNINFNPFFSRFIFRIREDIIESIHIDYGAKALIIKQIGNYILFKVPSHSSWAGIGLTDTIPTFYYLLNVEKFPDGKTNKPGYGEIIVEASPGRKYKKFLEWVEDYINKIS
ncbi:MAG: hypothetical protein ACOC1K_06770 [Nanoarchaeota archaeon]